MPAGLAPATHKSSTPTRGVWNWTFPPHFPYPNTLLPALSWPCGYLVASAFFGFPISLYRSREPNLHSLLASQPACLWLGKQMRGPSQLSAGERSHPGHKWLWGWIGTRSFAEEQIPGAWKRGQLPRECAASHLSAHVSGSAPGNRRRKHKRWWGWVREEMESKRGRKNSKIPTTYSSRSYFLAQEYGITWFLKSHKCKVQLVPEIQQR